MVFVTAGVAWPTIVPSTTSNAAICWPTPAVPSQVPFRYHFSPQTFPVGAPVHCATAAFAELRRRGAMIS